MTSLKWMVKWAQYWWDLGNRSRWQHYCAAPESTAAVKRDAETEMREQFLEHHLLAGPVSDRGSRRVVVEEVAGPERGNHREQGQVGKEVPMGNLAADSRREARSSDDSLGHQPELEGSHERHRAWEAILPPSKRSLGVGTLHVGLSALDLSARFSCLGTPLARGQKRPAMIPGGKGSSG